MSPDDLKTALATELQKAGKTSPSYPKRLHNILWVKDLSREGLAYNSEEKQILIKETSSSESIYIQYPGKESDPSIKNPPNEWDFRPKLFNEDKGIYVPDVSFDMLWIALENIFLPLLDTEKEIIRLFATMLYRMAFFTDHDETVSNNCTFKTRYLRNEVVYREEEEQFSGLHKYLPKTEAIDLISEKIPAICDMSIEGFLYYIELLTWNEDCKYYYRNILKAANTPHPEKVKWIDKTGRVNTLSTLIHFIGVLTGDARLSKAFSEFSKFGVSKISNQDILEICKGFIRG